MTQILTTNLIDSILEKNQHIMDNTSTKAISFTEEETSYLNEKYTQLLDHLKERRALQFKDALTFRALVWKTKFDDVFASLITFFEYENDSYEAIKKRYQQVLKTPVYNLELGLTVDEEGDISGIRNDTMYHSSLMFLTFDDWANAKVEPQSLATRGHAFFVAAAINEMGWMNAAEEMDCSLDEIKEKATAILENPNPPEALPISTVFTRKQEGASESIQTLFAQVTYEEAKEEFEQALDYLNHPLNNFAWDVFFKHAYHTIKYHQSTQNGPKDPIYFNYEQDFLTQYKNKSERKIKCVIWGDLVLDYLTCPTQTHSSFFNLKASEKVAYTLLAYIGDCYTENPNRFKEDEEFCQIENDIRKNKEIGRILLEQYLNNALDIASLSIEDFEQLFYCLHTIKDEYI